VKAAAWSAGWVAALFGLWLLLVGTNAGLEEIGGACAAAAAGCLHWAVTRARTRRIDPSLAWAGRLLGIPWAVVREFGVLVLALVRRPRGRFRAVPYPARGATPAAAGRRALLTFAGSLSPNTYVVDVDAELGTALVHDLDRRRAQDPL